MFYHIRFQTGELDDVVREMKDKKIPCMDVTDSDELEWVLNQLEAKGIYKVEGLPYDRNARDIIKEPDFEFRIAFYSEPLRPEEASQKELMHIDFYFEPAVEDTYDPVGEM